MELTRLGAKKSGGYILVAMLGYGSQLANGFHFENIRACLQVIKCT